jgi:hypothetical protein
MYITAIWSILWPFVRFCDHLVDLFSFCYVVLNNLATLQAYSTPAKAQKNSEEKISKN